MDKMADIDIDPFGEHESRPEEPTGENWNKPLTYGEGKLRSVGEIKKILGRGRLHKLGFLRIK